VAPYATSRAPPSIFAAKSSCAKQVQQAAASSSNVKRMARHWGLMEEEMHRASPFFRVPAVIKKIHETFLIKISFHIIPTEIPTPLNIACSAAWLKKKEKGKEKEKEKCRRRDTTVADFFHWVPFLLLIDSFLSLGFISSLHLSCYMTSVLLCR
jgi:hypothetical protein